MKDEKIIQLDEAQLREHLDRRISESVEDTLNLLLDQEADRICQAGRYERNPDRADTRAGHYKRKLHTKAGQVELKVPKLRNLPFETQIIERY
ncbi:MAG: transposase, partial [Verrucomicrobiae bacterium]|nr:transposase [Verrucomicrobiae bacterium]